MAERYPVVRVWAYPKQLTLSQRFCLFTDTAVAATGWLLEVRRQCTWACKYLFAFVASLPSDKYPPVALLGHRQTLLMSL